MNTSESSYERGGGVQGWGGESCPFKIVILFLIDAEYLNHGLILDFEFLTNCYLNAHFVSFLLELILGSCGFFQEVK